MREPSRAGATRATDHGVKGCKTLKDITRIYGITKSALVWRYAKGLRGQRLLEDHKPIMLCGKTLTEWSKLFAADGYYIHRNSLQNKYIYHSRVRKDPISNKEFLRLMVAKNMPHAVDVMDEYLKTVTD